MELLDSRINITFYEETELLGFIIDNIRLLVHQNRNSKKKKLKTPSIKWKKETHLKTLI